MKTILLISSLFWFTLTGWSQNFEVPKNYNLSTAEDFREYNQDIIDCAIWLYDKPYGAEKEKHAEAQEFFFSWMVGTPDVTLQLTSKVARLAKNNPDLLFIYMACYAKTVLENPDITPEETNAKSVYELVQYYVSNLDEGLVVEENMADLEDKSLKEISDWLN